MSKDNIDTNLHGAVVSTYLQDIKQQLESSNDVKDIYNT